MSVAFDTLRAARKLRDEGGFDERQAAILVDTFAEGMTETLATKADLEKTEASLRADLEKTEASLRAEIDTLRGDLEKAETSLRGEIKTLRGEMRELEQRMTIRLGAMMVAAVALIVALVKLV